MKSASRLSLRPVEWLNFFLADVQTGRGPFLAAYLTSHHWPPGSIGYLLTFGGLDGVADAIFGVVSVLVITDLTRGTGRFNLAAGGLATMVGLGASFSTALGGELIQHVGFNGSFLGLAVVAVGAVALLAIDVPEMLPGKGKWSRTP